MRKIFFASAFIFLFLTQSTSRAEVIEFSEDELARESVLPVFDQPEAVKRRYVPFDGRFEVGAFVGATLNDPFFNTYPFGLELKYHLSNFQPIRHKSIELRIWRCAILHFAVLGWPASFANYRSTPETVPTPFLISHEWKWKHTMVKPKGAKGKTSIS
jgi:hypothetical protein